MKFPIKIRGTPETLWRHTAPEDRHLHTRSRENLRFPVTLSSLCLFRDHLLNTLVSNASDTMKRCIAAKIIEIHVLGSLVPTLNL
jgi:hypothetical protein